MDSPQSIQYPWCIDIFLDENKKADRLHLDKFNDELVRRLIADEGIKELDNTDANYDSKSPEQNNYNLFYDTWNSWNILYDELQKKGRLK